MEMIPAPSRQWKTYSTWFGIAIVVLNAIALAIDSLSGTQLLDAETLVKVNGVLAALLVAAKFVKQNIPVEIEQKEEIVQAALKTPVKPQEPGDPFVK